MQFSDFAKEYAAKTDEELLRLALAPDQLTEDANCALSAELRSRGLGENERIAEFQQEEQGREQQQEEDTGQLWFLHPYGIGRKRFGKAGYVFDSISGLEEFSTTVFIVMFWLPLIPTGTYRVRRKKQLLSSHMEVLERLPLDWTQVLTAWLIAVGCLIGFVWVWRLLISIKPHI